MTEQMMDYEHDPEAREHLLQIATMSVANVMKAPPDTKFLVDQLIPAVGVTLLLGEAGGGKSWVAYDLIRAAATGTSWLAGTGPANGGVPIPALLFDFDSGWLEIGRRFRRLGFTGEEPVRAHIADEAPGALWLPNRVEEIGAVIEAHGAKLIVFDSLRSAVTGQEDNSEDMRSVMQQWKKLARGFNAQILILHHTPKTQMQAGKWQTRARGSGEIAAAADTIIEIEADEKIDHGYFLRWTKARRWAGNASSTLGYKLVDEETRTKLIATSLPDWRSHREVQMDRVLLALGGEGIGLSELAHKTGLTSQTLRSIVDEGVTKGILRTERGDRYSQKELVFRATPLP